MKTSKIVGFLLVVSIFLSSPGLSEAASLSELTARLDALLRETKDLQAQVASLSVTPRVSSDLSRYCPNIVSHQLRRGLRDTTSAGQVTRLQEFLASQSDLNFSIDSITGIFGPTTEAALRQFQANQGIVLFGSAYTTGFGAVGPLTRKYIDRIACLSPVTPNNTPVSSLNTPVISLYAPQVHSVYAPGSQVYIGWKSSNIPANAMISLTWTETSSGLSGPMATVSNTGSYTWTIPANFTPAYYYIRISKVDYPGAPSIEQLGSPETKIEVRRVSSSEISVFSPNGGETWNVGTQQKISWDGMDKNVDIILDTPPCPTGAVCTADIKPSYTIAKSVVGPTYLWTVGKNMDGATIPVGSYVMKVCVVNSTICDRSDSYFKITSSTTNQNPMVLSPNGGETWGAGDYKEISWSGTTGSVDILLLPYAGGDYTIAKNVSGSSYSWKVSSVMGTTPTVPTGAYYIKICLTGSTAICDKSNSYFKISAPTVVPPAPSVVISSDKSIAPAPRTVTINATLTNITNCYGVNWDFGDGTFMNVSPGCLGPLSTVATQTTSMTHTYTQAGTYNVSLSVEGTKSNVIQIIVSQPVITGAVTVTSPNGGEIWTIGTTKAITWTDTATSLGSTYDLYMEQTVYCYAAPCPPAEYTIAKNVSGSQYNWLVGRVFDQYGRSLDRGGDGIKICRAGSTTACDRSDNTIRIDVLAIISPNGGEQVVRGTNMTISWATKILTANDLVSIDLTNPSTNATVQTIVTNLPATSGSYSWLVPSTIVAGQYKMRVTCLSGVWVCNDSSDATFTISAPVTSVGPLEILIPAYFYPNLWSTANLWDKLVATKQANPTVQITAIVNPSSGPGTAADPNYTNGIQKLSNAGIKLSGYVHTSYGSRALTTVKGDIDTWQRLYPLVKGIFLDEQSASTNGTYYQELTTYAKSKGFTRVIGNPGTKPSIAQANTVDTILVYESAGLPIMSNYSEFDSLLNSKIGVIPYGVATAPSIEWLRSVANIAGSVYVTHDILPNPWDTLPTYWDTLVETIKGGL